MTSISPSGGGGGSDILDFLLLVDQVVAHLMAEVMVEVDVLPIPAVDALPALSNHRGPHNSSS